MSAVSAVIDEITKINDRKIDEKLFDNRNAGKLLPAQLRGLMYDVTTRLGAASISATAVAKAGRRGRVDELADDGKKVSCRCGHSTGKTFSLTPFLLGFAHCPCSAGNGPIRYKSYLTDCYRAFAGQ